MNKSNTLTLLTLLIFLLGISLLLTISLFSKPIPLTISEINLKHLNKNIKLQGNITNIKPIQNYDFTILTLQDNTGTISITLDKSLKKSQLTHKLSNPPAIIIGRVTQYKKELQITANKITFNKK